MFLKFLIFTPLNSSDLPKVSYYCIDSALYRVEAGFHWEDDTDTYCIASHSPAIMREK